jgi:hypothetical protein
VLSLGDVVQIVKFGSEVQHEDQYKVAYGALPDVVAHEMQHAMTAATLQFAYANQSGALDESLSDMFSAFIDKLLVRKDDREALLIAEGTAGDVLDDGGAGRDLRDPAKFKQPFHMRELVTKKSAACEDDYGGVHSNSGIPNYAFALMTVGGSSCPSSSAAFCTREKLARFAIAPMEALGWEKSLKLWWSFVESSSASPVATFQDVARATVALSGRLFPGALRNPKGPIRTVACAWVATGVISAEEAKKNWNVACVGPSGIPRIEDSPSCASGLKGTECTAAAGEKPLVCAWTGATHCCKREVAFSPTMKECTPGPDGCPSGFVCAARTADFNASKLFVCMPEGLSDCVLPTPAMAERPSSPTCGIK